MKFTKTRKPLDITGIGHSAMRGDQDEGTGRPKPESGASGGVEQPVPFRFTMAITNAAKPKGAPKVTE